VEDRATAALALRFYAGLHEGLGPAGALQRAQAEAAQAGHHPYEWAGFALHGRA
jgi:CHAT domain-containing protein